MIYGDSRQHIHCVRENSLIGGVGVTITINTTVTQTTNWRNVNIVQFGIIAGHNL